VLGSKSTKAKIGTLRQTVQECMMMIHQFKYFTMNEWVFDSKTNQGSNNFIYNSKDSITDFEIDTNKINWCHYSMNFGYGIKNYILKEESAIPSLGYNDVV